MVWSSDDVVFVHICVGNMNNTLLLSKPHIYIYIYIYKKILPLSLYINTCNCIYIYMYIYTRLFSIYAYVTFARYVIMRKCTKNVQGMCI